MRVFARSLSWLLLAAAAVPYVATAQSFEANYELTRPATADTDLVPLAGGLRFGQVRVASAFSPSAAPGAGLTFEAGKHWFGRFTVGRTVETDMVAIGGGYRWRDGESVSLQLSRGRGQDRLGLAVRYDWPRYYLRFGFDPKPYEGAQDMLRFSAGMRF